MRMTNERIDEIEAHWIEHFDSLKKQYKSDNLTGIWSNGEQWAWQTLQALRAERAEVERLQAKLMDIKQIAGEGLDDYAYDSTDICLKVLEALKGTPEAE